MRREEITKKDINTILEMWATFFYTDQKVRDIQAQVYEHPYNFIEYLLLEDPDEVLRIFHFGSLDHELERVGGLTAKWDVSESVDGELSIVLRENIPVKEKSQQQIVAEEDLNTRVAQFLRRRTDQ